MVFFKKLHYLINLLEKREGKLPQYCVGFLEKHILKKPKQLCVFQTPMLVPRIREQSCAWVFPGAFPVPASSTPGAGESLPDPPALPWLLPAPGAAASAAGGVCWI